LEKIIYHYLATGVEVNVIAPLSYNFSLRSGVKIYNALDIFDQTLKLLEAVSSKSLLVNTDVTYFYRENPVDEAVTRLTVLQLGLMRVHADKFISIGTVEEASSPHMVSGFNYVSFYADCICKVSRSSNREDFIVDNIYTSSHWNAEKLLVTFTSDGGMKWKLLK
jgi:hypothetical protein